jgi:hypothetical protein
MTLVLDGVWNKSHEDYVTKLQAVQKTLLTSQQLDAVRLE